MPKGIKKAVRSSADPEVVALYADVVAEALLAFSQDDRYGVEMMRGATAVQKKRATWQNRMALRTYLGTNKEFKGWSLQSDLVPWLKSMERPLEVTQSVRWTVRSYVVKTQAATWSTFKDYSTGNTGRRIPIVAKHQLIATVQQMRAEGVEFQMIADKLGIAIGTAHNWSRYKLPM